LLQRELLSVGLCVQASLRHIRATLDARVKQAELQLKEQEDQWRAEDEGRRAQLKVRALVRMHH